MGGNGSGELRVSDEPSYLDKRHQSIRTCLSGEVESSSSPIRRKTPDVKYPENVERRPDPDVRYPDEMVRRPDPDMRYPDEVGCQQDIIAAARYPDGMSENFRPGGMSDATCRKKERDTWHILGRIPHRALALLFIYIFVFSFFLFLANQTLRIFP